MIKDRIGNTFASQLQIPDYGTLFLIKESSDGINEYGGSDIADATKLRYLVKAAIGSTCLFTDGSLYRKDLAGWHKMGETPIEIEGNSSTKVSEIMNKTVIDFVNTEVMTVPSGFFKDCLELATIDIPNVERIEEQAFYGCKNLTKIILPKVNYIGPQAFKECSNLETVILSNENTVCVMGAGDCWSKTKLSTVGKIYVPDKYVDAYKGATNWSGYSGKIFPMSEMQE